jgi:hypothetical protein
MACIEALNASDLPAVFDLHQNLATSGNGLLQRDISYLKNHRTPMTSAGW